MFLRVLLNLVMHNYPPLVSGALQLLFRHFSQRQEVLQAFKQVISENFQILRKRSSLYVVLYQSNPKMYHDKTVWGIYLKFHASCASNVLSICGYHLEQ